MAFSLRIYLTKPRFRKLNNPSAMRNKGPILEVLKKQLQPNKILLEISSGVGIHSAYFAEHFPSVKFQPSEYDQNLFNSIEDCQTKNICDPVYVDIREDYSKWGDCGPFQEGADKMDFANCNNFFDYMLNINMMHITPFSCSIGLFYNAGKLLKPGGKLFTYGPYSVNGLLTPESNVRFNENLTAQNPEWGIRDLNELSVLAKQNSIVLLEAHDLPANNKCVVWQKIVDG
jgi:hypothetical protein